MIIIILAQDSSHVITTVSDPSNFVMSSRINKTCFRHMTLVWQPVSSNAKGLDYIRLNP